MKQKPKTEWFWILGNGIPPILALGIADCFEQEAMQWDSPMTVPDILLHFVLLFHIVHVCFGVYSIKRCKLLVLFEGSFFLFVTLIVFVFGSMAVHAIQL